MTKPKSMMAARHIVTKLLPFLILFLVFSQPVEAFNSSDVGDDCKSLLENFATTVELFMFCAISHARPIRLCEACILEYVNVQGCHDQILKLGDSGGKACQLELINLDRLEIIESTFKNVVDLWNRGRCDNCLARNGSGVRPAPSNATRRFRELGDRGDACFARNNGSECGHCAGEYRDLNQAYEQIKMEGGGGDVCIDLVDTMNSTRNKWSREFGCLSSHRHPDLSFLLTAAAIATATLLFYLTAFCTKKRARLEMVSDPGPSWEAGAQRS